MAQWWIIFLLVLFEKSFPIFARSSYQKIKKDSDSDSSVILKLSDTTESYRETAIWNEPGAHVIVRSAPSGKIFCKHPLKLAKHCELFLGQDVKIGTNKFLVTINSADQKQHFSQWVVVDVDANYFPATRSYEKESDSNHYLQNISTRMLKTMRGSWFRNIALSAGVCVGGWVATMKRKRQHADPHPLVKSNSARASEWVESGSNNGGSIIWIVGLAGLLVAAVRNQLWHAARAGAARTAAPGYLR